MNKLNKFNLQGKIALITGAAGLLGPEHAKALLEVNSKVVLVDISKEKLKELQKNLDNDNCFYYQLDVTSEKKIRELHDELNSKNLKINILINNAAINPKVTSDIENSLISNRLEDFDVNSWNAELDVGLKGAFLCSKVFGNTMANELGGGIILNIASDLSVIAPDQRLYRKDGIKWSKQNVKPITYSVIKFGLVGLTKYISTYWCEKNIRCNSLSPGGVFLDQDKYFVEKLTQQIPLGRMASPDEYRSAIQFLCSEASSYMTGQNLIIDGGRTTW